MCSTRYASPTKKSPWRLGGTGTSSSRSTRHTCSPLCRPASAKAGGGRSGAMAGSGEERGSVEGLARTDFIALGPAPGAERGRRAGPAGGASPTQQPPGAGVRRCARREERLVSAGQRGAPSLPLLLPRAAPVRAGWVFFIC